LTKIALELREFNHNGVNPMQAYDYIKRDYFANEEETGDLADARAQNQEN
jgi:hypothetical protein